MLSLTLLFVLMFAFSVLFSTVITSFGGEIAGLYLVHFYVYLEYGTFVRFSFSLDLGIGRGW